MSTTFLWCSKNTGNFFSQLTTHDACFLSRAAHSLFLFFFLSLFPVETPALVDFIIGKRFPFFGSAVFFFFAFLGGAAPTYQRRKAESEKAKERAKSKKNIFRAAAAAAAAVVRFR